MEFSNQTPHNGPQKAKPSYILTLDIDHVEGIGPHRTQEQVDKESIAATRKIIQELEKFIIEKKLEKNVQIENVRELDGFAVVRASPEAAEQLKQAKGILSVEPEMTMGIDPLCDGDLPPRL